MVPRAFGRQGRVSRFDDVDEDVLALRPVSGEGFRNGIKVKACAFFESQRDCREYIVVGSDPDRNIEVDARMKGRFDIVGLRGRDTAFNDPSECFNVLRCSPVGCKPGYLRLNPRPCFEKVRELTKRTLADICTVAWGRQPQSTPK